MVREVALPKTLQYPTTGTAPSRTLTYSYGTIRRHDDEINQLDSIVDDTTSETLDSIGYLGDGTIVSENYVQPGVGYNLLAHDRRDSRTSTSTAGCRTRFGRTPPG